MRNYNYQRVLNNLYKMNLFKYIGMNVKKIKLVLILVVLMMSFSLVSAKINFYSPTDEYLMSQDIYFTVCEENSSIDSFVFCQDDYSKKKISQYVWGEDCILGIYSPSSFNCKNPSIIAEIVNDEKLTISEEVLFNRIVESPNFILDKQNWDGGFTDPVSTSSAIWALSLYENLYENEIKSALEWLKVNRDNNFKCWPKENCNIDVTSKVMTFLTLAGINENNRIFYDGLVWLEEHQNYIEESEWSISLKGVRGNVSCNLTIDTSTREIEDINKTDYLFESFTVDYGIDIGIRCNERVIFNINDENNKTIYTKKSSRLADFKIPSGACWSNYDWIGCNDEVTLWASISNLSSERITSSREYLDSILKKDDYVGYFLTTNDPIRDTALYHRFIDESTSIATYLTFQQNNDGSFGKGKLEEIIFRTLLVIDSLENSNFSFSEEVIKDARSWVVNNLPIQGAGNIMIDSFYTNLFRDENLAYIRIIPNLIHVSSKETLISLFNPSQNNINQVKMSLSKSIDNVINVLELDNISSFSENKIELIRDDIEAGKHFGFLNISGIVANLTNESSLLGIFPIIIEESAEIDVEIPKIVRIMGSRGEIELNVLKSNGLFNCMIDFNDSFISSEKFEISSTLNKTKVNILVGEPKRQEKEVLGVLNCNFEDYVYEKKFFFNLYQYPKDVLELNKDEIIINKRRNKPELIIKNLIDEVITVSFAFENNNDFLVFNKNNVEIFPDENITITLLNNFETKNNYSYSNNLIIKTLDQRISIPVLVDVVYVPFVKTLFFKILRIIFLIALFLSLAYLIYYYSLDLEKKSKETITIIKIKSKDIGKKIKSILPSKIKEILKIKDSEDEKNFLNKEDSPVDYSGVASMIKIMLSLNHEEKDIKKRLKKEGLSDDEIEGALKAVHEELEDQEELEKEENIIKVIRKMDESSDVVRGTLKQAGFSDSQINQAFEEIEEELSVKEKELQDHLAALKGQEDDEEETSLLDLEKNKSDDE